MLDGDPALSPERGTAALTFRPMSVVAKRLPISATAELLFSRTEPKQIQVIGELLTVTRPWASLNCVPGAKSSLVDYRVLHETIG